MLQNQSVAWFGPGQFSRFKPDSRWQRHRASRRARRINNRSCCVTHRGRNALSAAVGRAVTGSSCSHAWAPSQWVAARKPPSAFHKFQLSKSNVFLKRLGWHGRNYTSAKHVVFLLHQYSLDQSDSVRFQSCAIRSAKHCIVTTAC